MASRMRLVGRILFGRAQRSLGIGTALIGVGYGLSFDYPLSYLPYGVCRSFEGLSEALPGLKERRLGVYERASRFAERWRLESPLLNAYLLDRLCRESVMRHRRLQQSPVEVSSILSLASPNPEITDEQKLIESCAELLPPNAEQKAQRSVEAQSHNTSQSSSASIAPDPLDRESKTIHNSSLNTGDNEVLEDQVQDVLPILPEMNSSKLSRWSSNITEKCSQSKQKLFHILSPAYIVGCLHNLLFPGAAKDPSFVSVMDRIHHTTVRLEPYCNNVERVRAVYVTLTNFLNFALKQRAFHEQLFRENSLENDKTILQFLHSALLATHRTAYITEYEKTVCIPPPPPTLPLPESAVVAPALWKKTTTIASEKIGGLISSFGPASKIKQNDSAVMSSSTMTVVPRTVPWTPLDVSIDCRRKIQNIWRISSTSRLVKNAAHQIVWKGERHPSRFEFLLQKKNGTSSTTSNVRIEALSEVDSLSASIKVLVQELNRSPVMSSDRELSNYMNESIQTPWALNIFGEQYSPSLICRLGNWILQGPVLPFTLGVGLTALYLMTSPDMDGHQNVLNSLRNNLSSYLYESHNPQLNSADQTNREVSPSIQPDLGFYLPNLTGQLQGGDVLNYSKPDMTGFQVLNNEIPPPNFYPPAGIPSDLPMMEQFLPSTNYAQYGHQPFLSNTNGFELMEPILNGRMM